MRIERKQSTLSCFNFSKFRIRTENYKNKNKFGLFISNDLLKFHRFGLNLILFSVMIRIRIETIMPHKLELNFVINAKEKENSRREPR